MKTKFTLRLRRSTALCAILTAGAFGFTVQVRAQAATTQDETVKLSPFLVSTSQDVGYRAGNSVSATRIDTPIKDLPFAVSAFTTQFITDIGARDLYDVVQYAPGVTTAGREFTAGNAVFNIRGFDQAPERNGFQGNAYVDTVDIERVEVVKGPASVLYGQVAPGGVVNYITKRPADKAFTKVNVQAGSHSFLRGQIDVNQPLAAGKLLFRVNAAYENGLENIDPARTRTTVYDPTLTWRINDRASFTVDFEHFERRESPEAQMVPNIEVATAASMSSNPLNPKAALSSSLDSSDPGFLAGYPLPDDFNYASANDWRVSKYDTLNADFELRLSDQWSARANFTWSQNSNRQKLTGLGTVYVSAPAGYTADSFAAAILADPEVALLSDHAYLPRRKRLQETFSHGAAGQVEAIGSYKFDWGTFKPLFGVYYNRSVGWNRLRQDAVADYFPAWDFKNPSTIDHDTDFEPVNYPLTTHTRSVTHNKAAYAVINGSFLNDRLYAVAGARYNYADSQTDNILKGTAGDEFTTHKTTPQAGVGCKITKDVLLYASYSESFVQNAASLTVNNQPAGPAKPTTSQGYEVGVKTDFLDGRVSSTLSVFRINQTDRIVKFNSFFNGSTVTNNIQGTVDRANGAELEVTYSPLDNWQIYASVTENDIRTIRVPAGYEYYLGAHPEASAKTLANLWTRYTFASGPAKGLWIGAGFNYSGRKAQRTNNKNLFLPAYTLLNCALGYDWKWNGTPMTATLNWSNVTDEDYQPANQQRGLPGRVVLGLTMKL
jgi:iron complex outermembrane receptor protein